MAKTATVNLTTGDIAFAETPSDLLRDYLGGRGLGARLLYDLVGPDVDPLGPDNYLIFTAAPLAGTPWPTGARMHVTFKSPATGAYGYANTGGQIVAQLRHAGYDAILVTGRAPVPSVLRVVDDDITIVPAPELWGLQTGAVHDALLGARRQEEQGLRRLHRSGRREPGAHRRDHQRPGRAAARRAGRGDGQQEPEGAAHHCHAAPAHLPRAARGGQRGDRQSTG